MTARMALAVAAVLMLAAPRPPTAAADTSSAAIRAALEPLDDLANDRPLRLQVAAGWKTYREAAVWVVGEIPAKLQGAEAEVMLTTEAGFMLARQRVPIRAGERTFRAHLFPSMTIVPGDYWVRARTRAAGAPDAVGTVHLRLHPEPLGTGALAFRRNLSTGDRETTTADLRFRSSEQIRVEAPAAHGGDVSARLLDRTGKPLDVPVRAVVREQPDGSWWNVATLALAPLGPGDYLIELSGRSGRSGRSGGLGTEGTEGAETRGLVAFRVVP